MDSVLSLKSTLMGTEIVSEFDVQAPSLHFWLMHLSLPAWQRQSNDQKYICVTQSGKLKCKGTGIDQQKHMVFPWSYERLASTRNVLQCRNIHNKPSDMWNLGFNESFLSLSFVDISHITSNILVFLWNKQGCRPYENGKSLRNLFNTLHPQLEPSQRIA